MPKKVREIIRLLERDGWYLVKSPGKGSGGGNHRQYKHATKPGRFPISGNPGHDMSLGTLDSVLKQAALKASKED